MTGLMVLVELAQDVELRALLALALTGAARQVGDLLAAAGVEGQRLIVLRQETRRPDAVVATRLRLVHNNERGQVLVERTESVGDPGPHARIARAHLTARDLH